MNSICGSIGNRLIVGGVKDFIDENIQKRKRAKKEYTQRRHTLAVSLHISSVSTYTKARNLNKRKRIRNN